MHYLNVELKILHRDLKAENVFLNKENDDRLLAKIGDFGLAINKLIKNEDTDRFHVASPAWMVSRILFISVKKE
jgi:serine/threonine protein kinase